ncbi:hypothetical protein [Rhodococcus aetherivorans]|uniref:hypothetical protein n=1 Tax=Rhodococcus aetherivorans TaxID=191292 RepID=UPI001E2E90D0|nr:hypothetical protein [Rhodococcus aetherivorans]UGQ41209.1 hypothetical protein LRQ66_24365 [Rhodococcus aetherivorans]
MIRQNAGSSGVLAEVSWAVMEVMKKLQGFKYSDDALPDMTTGMYARTAGAWRRALSASHLVSHGKWDVSAAAIRESLELAALDSKDQVRAHLDINLTSRLHDEAFTFSTISGRDRSQSILVSIEMDRSKSTFRFHMEVKLNPSSTPHNLLPAVEFLENVQSGNRIALMVPGTRKILSSTDVLENDEAPISNGLANTIRALARLQQRARQEFPMPAEITRNDLQEIVRGIDLLDGKKGRGTWSNTVVKTAPGSGKSIRDAAQGAHGALLEITAPVEIQVSDRILDLGTGTYTLAQAVVDTVTEGEDGDEVRFIPGEKNQFEVSLTSPPRRIADNTLAQPPIDLLRQHAGEWIAHAGAHILASGPTPAAVAAALRELGERGSIWRVPSTPAEAEFNPVDL